MSSHTTFDSRRQLVIQGNVKDDEVTFKVTPVNPGDIPTTDTELKFNGMHIQLYGIPQDAEADEMNPYILFPELCVPNEDLGINSERAACCDALLEAMAKLKAVNDDFDMKRKTVPLEELGLLCNQHSMNKKPIDDNATKCKVEVEKAVNRSQSVVQEAIPAQVKKIEVIVTQLRGTKDGHESTGIADVKRSMGKINDPLAFHVFMTQVRTAFRKHAQQHKEQIKPCLMQWLEKNDAPWYLTEKKKWPKKSVARPPVIAPPPAVPQAMEAVMDRSYEMTEVDAGLTRNANHIHQLETKVDVLQKQINMHLQTMEKMQKQNDEMMERMEALTISLTTQDSMAKKTINLMQIGEQQASREAMKKSMERKVESPNKKKRKSFAPIVLSDVDEDEDDPPPPKKVKSRSKGKKKSQPAPAPESEPEREPEPEDPSHAQYLDI